jgi:16S rRNA (uracil1498-N3)-methyltransferase
MTFTENHFYAPDASEGRFDLPEDEAQHAVKVLRLRPGDVLTVTDGKGRVFECRLASVQGKSAVVETLAMRSLEPERPEITLGIGTLKKPAMEALVEWACQLPVKEVAPFSCDFSQAAPENIESMRLRLETKALTAMKQSKRGFLTGIRPARSFEQVLKEGDFEKRILFEKTDSPDALEKEALGKAERLLLLIGPEGGFSVKEMDMARREGLLIASLGRTRLRAEAAAFAAVTSILTRMEKRI